MAQMLQQMYPGREMHFVFANTGQEMEQTLEFVDRCDSHFGWGVVWVEAVVHSGRKSCTHKVVNFDTAARGGEPFEAVVAKYGLPNKGYFHCTRELKQNPIRSYVASLGFHSPRQYEMAIGIRADEPKRVSTTGSRYGAVYPLVDAGVDKPDVNAFFEQMPFNLELLEHQGNCKWCYKKSDRKHATLYREMPEIYEFPAQLELDHGHIGSERQIFRGRRNTAQYVEYLQVIASDAAPALIDEDSGCSESCEPFMGGV
jgi:hypothetical protein